MLPLTKKQKAILDFIKDYVSENGVAPSYIEIGQHFELSSKATVAQYLKMLQEKGYLSKDGTARGVTIRERQSAPAIELPLVGLIAAGQPIEAVEDTEVMSVPSDLISEPGDSFILKVIGNSMIEDGILSGDYVIAERQPSPKNGDIVIALIDQNYATLKRFYREGNRIRLQPANSTMSPIYCQNPIIQGVVRAVIRRFPKR